MTTDAFETPVSKKYLMDICSVKFKSGFDTHNKFVSQLVKKSYWESNGEPSPVTFEVNEDTTPFSPERGHQSSIISVASCKIPLNSTQLNYSLQENSDKEFLELSTVSLDGSRKLDLPPLVDLQQTASKPRALVTASKRKLADKDKDIGQESSDCHVAKKRMAQRDMGMAACPLLDLEQSDQNFRISSSGSENKLPKSRLPVASKSRISSPGASGILEASSLDHTMKSRSRISDVEKGHLTDKEGMGLPKLDLLLAENLDHDAMQVSCELSVCQAIPPMQTHSVGKKVPSPDKTEADQKRRRTLAADIPEEYGLDSSAVTVAIRVRPLNSREHELNTKSVISVTGQETIVFNPESQQKFSFVYDFSFWSCDPQDRSYASQEVVYRKLAQPLLKRVLQGYNVCLFAYGQTGSGKSYTMMGYGDEAGVIPRFCEKIFLKSICVDCNSVTYHIEMSYFEVYNERIHDLLTSDKEQSKAKASSWLQLGNKQRATASTGMNEKSSRSHSVFTLVVTQTKRETLDGEIYEHTMRSHVNLVDLAGSERSSTAQTTGVRLKEGASINKSLMTLGKVICALSEASHSKKKPFIPYRDSVLTWLLKESLGGNSKTAMIATVSPAAVSLEETLSTLRYAKQARKIVNVAKINEDPSSRIIRDLKAEIEKLRAMQQNFQGIDALKCEADLQEIFILKQKLLEQEQEMNRVEAEWKEKLALAELRKMEEAKELQKAGISLKVDNRLPNLVNLNEDPQLSEMLLYIIKEGETKVGRLMAGSDFDIQLTGALIAEHHCLITNKEGTVTLTPTPEAETYLNGKLITEPVTLHHGDRVVLGGQHYFRFNHPLEVQKNQKASEGSCTSKEMPPHDFEFAKNELIEAQNQRIEAEVDEAWQHTQQEILLGLQAAKDAAQKDLSDPHERYEDGLCAFQDEMEEELNPKQEKLSHEVKEKRSKIHLKKLLLACKAESLSQEFEETRLRHCKFMEALELEKAKLSQEVADLKQAQASRGEEQQMIPQQGNPKWTSLRLSLLLQEANAISRGLKKHTVFTRYESPCLNNGLPSLYIKVTNTKLRIFTIWNLEKFEFKLISMRELYQGVYEGSGDQLFYDPSDSWDADGACQSPRRRRSSLTRRYSDSCWDKAFRDVGSLVEPGCAAACKHLISTALEGLEVASGTRHLLDKLLLDLCTIVDSVKTITESYRDLHRMSHGTPEKVPDPSIYLSAATSVYSMVTTLQICQMLITDVCVQKTHLKILSSEVKMLGGSLALLIHGCENDIESIVEESQKKIHQSSLVIASQLGGLVVSMGPKGSFTMMEKCSLEQAELINDSLKIALVEGAHGCVENQISESLLLTDNLHAQICLELPGKVTEEAKKALVCVTSSFKAFMKKISSMWELLTLSKRPIPDVLPDKLFLLCQTLYSLLTDLQTGLKQTVEMTPKHLKAWNTPDLQILKPHLQSLPKAAETLTKTLDVLCVEVHQELHDPIADDYWAAMNKEAELAAQEFFTSVKELLKLLERLRGVDCPDSGSWIQKHKKMPPSARWEPSIQLWVRSGTAVRDVVAKLNYQSLSQQGWSPENRRTIS
ncbi:kinesin-like protein KIF14 isoform X2 [Erpetoichthys calabaricus]|uniref:kinesin-like protein KIF14 isoform X2 n=1 Tax=Erpetoichthys calabaricus TaxID=27687 RepID=UPI00223440C8|nr:kinesin-like protein KIF14 isoform X2 [Erpetoichthys calabaricus]